MTLTADWRENTRSSLPVSEWAKESATYGIYSAHKGFTCLSDSDPQFVDFRYWSDNGNVAKFWTVWRLPYSKNALDQHVECFELSECSLSQDMRDALASNIPKDWNLELDSQFVFYQPKLQVSISYFCRLLLYDKKEGVIYFYDMDQEVPA